MKTKVINHQGEETGRSVELPKDIFSITPNEHVVYLAVKHYQANQRQGTAKTKERGEVKGSTAKLYKQKGTGNARRGSIKSPLLRGGGTIFGPKPRNYNSKINKKTKELAWKSILSDKAGKSSILVLEDFSLDEAKTKAYKKVLTSLKVEDQKTLLILPESNKNILLAARNLPKAEVVTPQQLNVFNMMHAQKIILCEKSLSVIIQKFK